MLRTVTAALAGPAGARPAAPSGDPLAQRLAA